MKAIQAEKNAAMTTPESSSTRTSMGRPVLVATRKTRMSAMRAPPKAASGRTHEPARYETQREDRHCANGGPTGDSQDVRFGERVSKKRLKRRSRDAQSAPDEEGEQDPRKAQAKHDVPGGRVTAAPEHGPYFGRGKRHRSEADAEQ